MQNYLVPMTEVQQLKQSLLAHCRTVTQARIDSLSAALQYVKAARDGETKSSAGDKYETGRAMMQLEAAKLSRQLAEANTDYAVLDQITVSSGSEFIAAGSLVATNRGNYFLGLGLGKVKLEGRVFFCTSLAAPVGAAMMGKSVGESFTFNSLEFKVLGLA